MKKIISSPLMLIFSILILTGVFFSGCNSDTTSDGGITAGDVIGTWIKVWDGDSYQLPSGTEADTLIFDIGESDLEAVFYLNTEQVGGFKGTYSISDDEIVVSVTHTWNENWDLGDSGDPVWNEESDEYVFPFTPGSNTLAVTDSYEEVIVMDKITFGKPDFLSDPPYGWFYGDSLYLYFRAEDEIPYTYNEPGNGIREGTWDASGTESGYIRTVVTSYSIGDTAPYLNLNWGFLNPYSYYKGEGIQLDIEMYYGDGITTITFEPDTASIE